MTNFENTLNNTIVNLRVRQIYEPKLNTIILRLEQLKSSANNNNPIRGIVKAYLDIFSDYDNPIIEDLSYLATEAERFYKK